jgi:hypothetical protein
MPRVHIVDRQLDAEHARIARRLAGHERSHLGPRAIGADHEIELAERALLAHDAIATVRKRLHGRHLAAPADRLLRKTVEKHRAQLRAIDLRPVAAAGFGLLEVKRPVVIVERVFSAMEKELLLTLLQRVISNLET